MGHVAIKKDFDHLLSDPDRSEKALTGWVEEHVNNGGPISRDAVAQCLIDERAQAAVEVRPISLGAALRQIFLANDATLLLLPVLLPDSSETARLLVRRIAAVGSPREILLCLKARAEGMCCQIGTGEIDQFDDSADGDDQTMPPTWTRDILSMIDLCQISEDVMTSHVA